MRSDLLCLVSVRALEDVPREQSWFAFPTALLVGHRTVAVGDLCDVWSISATTRGLVGKFGTTKQGALRNMRRALAKAGGKRIR